MTTSSTSDETNRQSITEMRLPVPLLPTGRQVGVFLAYLFGATIVGVSPSIVVLALATGADLLSITPETGGSVVSLIEAFVDVLNMDAVRRGTSLAGAGVILIGVLRTDNGPSGHYITKLHLASAVGLLVVVGAVATVLTLAGTVLTSLAHGFTMPGEVSDMALWVVGSVNTISMTAWALFFVIPATLVSVGVVRERSDYRRVVTQVGIAGAVFGLFESVLRQMQYYLDPELLAVTGRIDVLYEVIVNGLMEGFAIGVAMCLLAITATIVLALFHDILRYEHRETSDSHTEPPGGD